MTDTPTRQLDVTALAGLDDLYESPENPRSITAEAFERLKYALDKAPGMMKARPIIAMPDGEVIAGNMRLRALKEMGVTETWVFFSDLDEVERTEWMLRDNQGYGDYVPDELAMLLQRQAEAGGDMGMLGFAQAEIDDLLARAADRAGNGSGDGPGGGVQNPSLAERFGVPPFSVLDARSHAWRDRKREWLQLGIESELGREDNPDARARASEHVQDPRFYEKKAAAEQQLGRELSSAEFIADHYHPDENPGYARTGTSIFDPVVCELAVRWFSGPGQLVLDPFAGGSVRGIVAAKLGREYVGQDLRPDQVEANQAQADRIMGDGEPSPVWTAGDSTRSLPPCDADLLFTCPPYFDLEVYSDDPGDLSRAENYDAFRQLYRHVLQQSVDQLRDDRFAALVVGDVRDKKGYQRPLVADTIRAMEDAGARYYGEAILVQPVGSLRIRAARAFVASRKLGRTHQQLLVFVKGDPRRAADNAGELDLSLVQQDEDAQRDQEDTD